MECRKIQITGGSSFMVTLPKEWVESAGLKKNDPVYMSPGEGGSMMISAHRNTDCSYDTECTIEAPPGTDPAFLMRKLIGCYIAGHATITVHSTCSIDSETYRTVREFSRTAVGMEIMDEDGGSIVLKNLLDPVEVRPDIGIERMRTLTKGLLSETVKAMLDGRPLESLDGRDRDVDRIYWYIARQAHIMLLCPWICLKSGIDPTDMSEYLNVSRIIESISDHVVTMNDCMSFMNDPIEVQSLGTVVDGLELPDLFTGCMDSFMNKNAEAADECISRCEKTIVSIREVLELGSMMDPRTSTAAAMMSGNIKRMLRYFMDICEAAIDTAMR